jgi:hypothetical protein
VHALRACTRYLLLACPFSPCGALKGLTITRRKNVQASWQVVEKRALGSPFSAAADVAASHGRQASPLLT